MYSPLWKITHQSPLVLCTPPFEKPLFWVGAYFGVGVYLGKYDKPFWKIKKMYIFQDETSRWANRKSNSLFYRRIAGSRWARSALYTYRNKNNEKKQNYVMEASQVTTGNTHTSKTCRTESHWLLIMPPNTKQQLVNHPIGQVLPVRPYYVVLLNIPPSLSTTLVSMCVFSLLMAISTDLCHSILVLWYFLYW